MNRFLISLIVFFSVFAIFFPFAILWFLILFLGSSITLSRIYIEKISEGIDFSREIDVQSIFYGEEFEVRLKIKNKTKLPIFYLYITDNYHFELGFLQHFKALLFLYPLQEKRITYKLQGNKRGKYPIGPAKIIIKDLLGIYKREIDFEKVNHIIVYPAISRVGYFKQFSRQPYGPLKNPLPIYEDMTNFKGIRDYNIGDELKRINWKKSARFTDKLVVNIYNYSISTTTLIFLNMFLEDYPVRKRLSLMENAIEISASLLYYFYRYNQDFGIVINGNINKEDRIISIDTAKGNYHLIMILTSLALLSPTRQISFDTALENNTISLKWGTTITILTPRLSEKQRNTILTLLERGFNVDIFFIENIQEEMLMLKDLNTRIFEVRKIIDDIQIKEISWV